MKVLIIEDEETAARGLINLLEKVEPSIEVLRVLDNIKSCIEWFKTEEEPDLIFMDIQLKDGISFKILDEIEIKCPVIFCTAYDQYALQAFKVNSIDYLLKPIDEQQLNKSIQKYQSLKNKLSSDNTKELFSLYEHLKSTSEYKKRFLVKSGKNFYYVKREDIAFFWTESKVVFLITFEGKKFILDQNLEQLESLLPPTDFFRINRQYIISINSLKSVQNDYGTYYIKLIPELTEPVNVSKYRVEAFKAWMDGQ